MAYELRTDESLSVGCKRVAMEQIDAALAHARKPRDPDEAVHEIRKACKRVRALLRLTRSALCKSTYRSELAAVGEIARALTAHRERAVGEKTADLLADIAEGKARRSVKALRGHYATVAESAGSVDRALQKTSKDLAALRKRARKWPLDAVDKRTVNKGLRRILESGRTELIQAEAETNSEHLHEWRKHAKNLWYVSRLLRARSERLAAVSNVADELGDLLGSEHDLADLEIQLDQLGKVPDLDALHKAIAKRRAKLRAKAFELGRPLYAHRNKWFKL